MTRLVKKYWSLPRLERVGLSMAYVMLGLAWAAIHTVRFKQLVSYLGTSRGISSVVPVVNRSTAVRARRVGWVVQTAARFTPWPSNCFAQTLVAATLLQRLGVPHGIYFGVARDEASDAVAPRLGVWTGLYQRPAVGSGLKAHAWVASGPCAVVGGRSFEEFGVVGCWVWWAIDQ